MNQFVKKESHVNTALKENKKLKSGERKMTGEQIFFIVMMSIFILLFVIFAISSCIYENRRIEREWEIMRLFQERQQRELLEILSKNK